MRKTISKYLYDYLGIAGSGICLIHCLATPLIMLFQTYYKTEFGAFLHEEIRYLDYLFLSICFIAVYFTTKEMISKKISRAFWLFFLLFAIAILFEEESKYLELIGYCSSVALIITHLINIKTLKKGN